MPACHSIFTEELTAHTKIQLNRHIEISWHFGSQRHRRQKCLRLQTVSILQEHDLHSWKYCVCNQVQNVSEEEGKLIVYFQRYIIMVIF